MVALGTEGIALALGPEWRVTDAEEMGSLAGPLAVYLESVGVTEAPPLVVFVGAVIAYSVKRAEHENTRTKLAVAFVKARGFVSGLIDKLTGR
jgi:predicted membrane-bound mannosyltransferase